MWNNRVQEPFFADGGLHTRGFAYHGEIDSRQLFQSLDNTVLPGDFFLGGCQKDKVVGLFGFGKVNECA